MKPDCRLFQDYFSWSGLILLGLALLSLCTGPSLAAEPAADTAWQATYRGSLVPQKEEDGNSPQPFTLQVVVSQLAAKQWQLDWVLQESGRAQWPWPSQYGSLTWQDGAAVEASSSGPGLLHPHDERKSIVRFPSFFVTGGDTLKAGQSWQEGKNTFRVAKMAKILDRPCWQVTVSNNYGLQQTLWVEKGQPLVLGGDSRVVLGQGKEHRLQFELTELRPLNKTGLQQLRQAFDTMAQLRDQLEVKPGNTQYDWSDEQLKLLRELLPRIRQKLRDTPLFQIAQLATQDASDQKDRKLTIAAITKRIMGKEVSELKVQGLKGEPFPKDGLKDAVVVLHFWEYRDKPLVAPYGQVGYLDFLYQKYQKQGLKIYGVAADLRLADAQQRPAAIRGIKKLVEFMNLSYPVMVDSAGTLERLGDPRAAEAKLPLFLVLDRNSKVIHYHVGYYQVQRDRGLEALDTVVKKALGK
jgi:alkyl hydroperoxide reductase subunit AhpC